MSDDNRHPFQLLEDPFIKEEVEIDEDLVPLIQAIWNLDIETLSCCQSSNNHDEDTLRQYPHLEQRQSEVPMAYVDFFCAEDVTFFMNAILEGGPSSQLLHRMNHWIYSGSWEIHAMFRTWEREGFRSLGYQVQFPHEDIPEMTACLERFISEQL